MKSLSLIAVVLLGGCFDSLLDSPCREGYAFRDGRCVDDFGTAPDGGLPDSDDDATPDGGGPGGDVGPVADAGNSDAPPDGPVCTAIPDDPRNCGACGRVCASGICTGSVCAGEVPGHVVAIGHDFTATNAGVLRVLGNAAAMGQQHDLAIVRWGASSSVTQALTASLGQLGRPWHAVGKPAQPSATALDGVDVVIVDPRGDDDDDDASTEGAAWNGAFAAFLDRGGVVIVLERASGTNVEFAAAAGLFTSGAPVAVTGAHLVVTAATDAVAQHVPSPYAAAAATVAFPGLPAVVATGAGETVVFHAAVP